MYRWDLRMNKPTVRHMNEAGSTSTSIAVSHNGQHYAVGYAARQAHASLFREAHTHRLPRVCTEQAAVS